MRASTRKRSADGGGTPVPAAPDDRPLAALVESYIDWREECAALESAYERWTGSPHPERDIAFSAYHAALDREEKAAAVFGSAARQLTSRASG